MDDVEATTRRGLEDLAAAFPCPISPHTLTLLRDGYFKQASNIRALSETVTRWINTRRTFPTVADLRRLHAVVEFEINGFEWTGDTADNVAFMLRPLAGQTRTLDPPLLEGWLYHRLAARCQGLTYMQCRAEVEREYEHLIDVGATSPQMRHPFCNLLGEEFRTFRSRHIGTLVGAVMTGPPVPDVPGERRRARAVLTDPRERFVFAAWIGCGPEARASVAASGNAWPREHVHTIKHLLQDRVDQVFRAQVETPLGEKAHALWEARRLGLLDAAYILAATMGIEIRSHDDGM